MKYEWHTAKAASNLIKHGVTFEEAATACDDPFQENLPDLAHSFGEMRYLCLGLSSKGRVLAVIYTERGDKAHIISAERLRNKKRWNTMSHEVTILTDDDYDLEDDIAPEYDIAAMREAARVAGYETHRRFIRLAPDVAAVFANAEAVNNALREIMAARGLHSSDQQ